MKRIEKIYSTYMCETCDKKYASETEAVDCERAHNCKHKETIFQFTPNTNSLFCFSVEGILHKCRYCNKKLGEVMFEDAENNQEVMKHLYIVGSTLWKICRCDKEEHYEKGFYGTGSSGGVQGSK